MSQPNTDRRQQADAMADKHPLAVQLLQSVAYSQLAAKTFLTRCTAAEIKQIEAAQSPETKETDGPQLIAAVSAVRTRLAEEQKATLADTEAPHSQDESLPEIVL